MRTAILRAVWMLAVAIIGVGCTSGVAGTSTTNVSSPLSTTTSSVLLASPTTLSPTTTTLRTTTTLNRGGSVDGIELRGDGIGVASFGEADETTIDKVRAFLGDPVFDSGYIPGYFADHCGEPELSRTVYWGRDWAFKLEFVQEPVRTVAGDMVGFVSYASTALVPAGEGAYVSEEPDPWPLTPEGLRLLDGEELAEQLYDDRLSEPIATDGDGLVTAFRHLDLGGPWPVQLSWQDSNLVHIVSGPCPIHQGLRLEGNGVGIAQFGDHPDTVIARVSRVLGPPTEDSGFVDEQVVGGFCGPGLQRSVSWGDFHLGFVDREYAGYVGLIAYGVSARSFIEGNFVTIEDPWPVVALPMGVRLLEAASHGLTQFGDNLSPVSDHPLGDGSRWAFLDLGGPWPAILWFDEADTDRITRITSTPCGE